MSPKSWLQNLRSGLAPRSRQRMQARRDSRRAATHRLTLEPLEDRRLLAFTPVASFAGDKTLAADFNNDHVPDLISSGGGVLLGNGDGTFTSAPGPAVHGTAVGDLDGDGNLDLVGSSGPDVTVLMGHGDGTFAAASNIRVAEPEASVSAAVGDFNGDGKLDLGVTSNLYHSFYDPYYGNWGYFSSNAHVLLGDGSGGFSGPNTTALETYSWQQFWVKGAVDLNGDGFDELLTTEGVLPGDASGYLQTPVGYFDPAEFADLDGDHDTDIVTLNDGVRVSLGNGSFYGMTIADYSIGYYPSDAYASQTSVALADFNGDGTLDIVTTSNGYNSTGNYMGRLNVLLGYGDGTFAPALNQDLSAPAYFVVADDFDGDGLADVAVTTYQAGVGQVNVLRSAGDWDVRASVAISDAAIVTEGDSGTVDAVFTVTRKGNLSATVSVPYWTGGGDATAGSDYLAQSGTITFGPNETTKYITIKVKGDLIDEHNQVFGVHLNDATGAIATDRDGFCSIIDNDPDPTVTITAKVSAKEGNGPTKSFNFIVTLSAPSEKEVRINFATANGTATTADNDYVANSGTLLFAPGQTSKTIQVLVKGDKKKESKETFFVNLFGATNATIVSAQGLGEILDDDTR